MQLIKLYREKIIQLYCIFCVCIEISFFMQSSFGSTCFFGSRKIEFLINKSLKFNGF